MYLLTELSTKMGYTYCALVECIVNITGLSAAGVKVVYSRAKDRNIET